MNIEIKFDVEQSQKLDRKLQDILQVAAVKALEVAVERTPARGETPYASGQLRESLRVAKTGEFEYTIFCPMPYGMFVEFGTGPRGKATGAVPEFPDDPQVNVTYHTGEVLVTRHRGKLLDTPYIRHTQGMNANSFLRYALLEGVSWIKKLIDEM